MGHLITNALARPFLHLLIPTRRPRRESQLWLWDQLKPSPRSHRRSLARSGERRGRQGAAAIPLVNLSVFIRLLALWHARNSCALALARSRQFVPACWRAPQPKGWDVSVERHERARRRNRASTSSLAVAK